MTKVAKVLVKNKQFGSSTIKREDAIVKGTRGKGIARLEHSRKTAGTSKIKVHS